MSKPEITTFNNNVQKVLKFILQIHYKQQAVLYIPEEPVIAVLE